MTYIFWLLMILPLRGFSNPLPSISQPTEKVGEPKGINKEGKTPANSKQTLLEYKYKKESKLDPFKPWLEKKVLLEPEIIDPLQKSDLADMTLVGTILGNDPVAMVTIGNNASSSPGQNTINISENTKETFMVRIGEPIGNRRGKLIAIAQDHIVVRELAKTKEGSKKHQFQLSTLKMSNQTKRPKGYMIPGGGKIPETSQSMSIRGSIGLPGESTPPERYSQGIPPTIQILPGSLGEDTKPPPKPTPPTSVKGAPQP